jgi:hypothetical protein
MNKLIRHPKLFYKIIYKKNFLYSKICTIGKKVLSGYIEISGNSTIKGNYMKLLIRKNKEIRINRYIECFINITNTYNTQIIIF